MNRATRLVAVCGCALVAGMACAQESEETSGLVPGYTPDMPPPLAQYESPLAIDSGPLTAVGQPGAWRLVYETTVRVEGADWLRLKFEEATMGGTADLDGAYIIVRSQEDGYYQFLNGRHLREWYNTSAYFNGDAVDVEVYAQPGTSPSRLRMSTVIAGSPQPIPESICGPTDDRTLFDDPRIGRHLPEGCTGWLFNGLPNGLLAAGHCGVSAGDVVQFHVPLSVGGLQHPPPQDQYSVDGTSVQTQPGGTAPGNDWCFFGCFDNSTTGIAPGVDAGDTVNLYSTIPGTVGDIRITGYGTGGQQSTWTQVGKTHVGPFAGISGTTPSYVTDTTGGNSGSPIIDENTGMAIGIHGYGGCTSTGGSNSGTTIAAAGFQNALANPLGVAGNTAVSFNYLSGRPEIVDPSGGTAFTVQIMGSGSTQIVPASVRFNVDTGSGFVALTPAPTGQPNTWELVVPASTCGSTVDYFVSVDLVGGGSTTNPPAGAGAPYNALSASGIDIDFEDNFQTNMGWVATADASTTTGFWDREVPNPGFTRGEPTADADGSGICYVTGNTLDEDLDGGAVYLTSPPFNVTQPGTTLEFAYWYNDSPNVVGPEDFFRADIATNAAGTNWQTAFTATSTAASWRNQSISLPMGATIRVRFVAADNDPGDVVEAGIDAVRISRVVCSTGCAPDLTTGAVAGQPGYGVPNGILNNDDFFYFLAQFAAGNLAVADITTGAVAGQPGYGVPNGVITNDDFFYYLAIFANGC
ncbi:MAG: GC-type dockerin domain-anchored protein [Phycisphaerales bacterium]